jgi:TRAP-type C4-dicarboxylate transport system permease large subunit
VKRWAKRASDSPAWGLALAVEHHSFTAIPFFILAGNFLNHRGGPALAGVLGGVTWYRARKFNYPRLAKATWGERYKAFKASAWGLLLIVIVMGGIYTGMFTPTEAAAMSAAMPFLWRCLSTRTWGSKTCPRCC